MTILIQGNTLSDTYIKILQTILEYGVERDDERGDTTLEVLNLVAEIKAPMGDNFYGIPDIQIPEGFVFGKEELDIYKEQFINPNNQGFVYTYGERLRSYPSTNKKSIDWKTKTIDQIDELINRLNRNISSRRAIAVTWNPSLDYINEDVPCLIAIDFKIRDGYLYPTVLYRSHDALLAWFSNLVGITHLCSYVMDNIEFPVKLGSITIQSISAHIRYRELDLAKELIELNEV